MSYWEKLDGPWRAILEREGLAEFKAKDCEHGEGPYKNKDRVKLQKEFIDAILAVPLQGFVAWMDLGAMHEVATKTQLPVLTGFRVPYLLAFSMAIQLIGHHLATSPIPVLSDERIDFVFDQQDRLASKALAVANALRNDSRFKVSSRLGPVAFDDSTRQPGLQAADLLAYQAHRVRTHGPRWQWDALKGRVVTGVWDRPALEDYAKGLRLPTGEPESAATSSTSPTTAPP